MDWAALVISLFAVTISLFSVRYARAQFLRVERAYFELASVHLLMNRDALGNPISPEEAAALGITMGHRELHLTNTGLPQARNVRVVLSFDPDGVMFGPIVFSEVSGEQKVVVGRRDGKQWPTFAGEPGAETARMVVSDPRAEITWTTRMGKQGHQSAAVLVKPLDHG